MKVDAIVDQVISEVIQKRIELGDEWNFYVALYSRTDQKFKGILRYSSTYRIKNAQKDWLDWPWKESIQETWSLPEYLES